MKTLLMLLCFLSFVSGCAVREEFIPPEPNDAAFAPPDLDYSLPEAKNGSLYRHNYSMTLFQDRRAYRVGDVLTVELDEQTQSSKKANTKFGKSSSIEFAAPTLGNKTFDDLSASVSGDRGFDGTAASTQGNKLQGAITVTVHKVSPNRLSSIVILSKFALLADCWLVAAHVCFTMN